MKTNKNKDTDRKHLMSKAMTFGKVTSSLEIAYKTLAIAYGSTINSVFPESYVNFLKEIQESIVNTEQIAWDEQQKYWNDPK